jgi:hypothetical protein
MERPGGRQVGSSVRRWPALIDRFGSAETLVGTMSVDELTTRILRYR